jgi:hypothetical protein
VSWFTVSRGRLAYGGRITRAPFTQWCATRQGREAVARAAAGVRFSLFGRSHAARSRLWRDLEAATRSEAFVEMAGGEPARYLQILADACYANGLPRAHIASRRLVVVPRAFVLGRAEAAAATRLMSASALAGVEPAIRTFLVQQIVAGMDAAVRAASTPKAPVQARDGWACVGAHLGVVWMDALWAGPDGTGHLFMYEVPPQGIGRRDRHALNEAMQRLGEDVARLSRTARDTLLRSASLTRTG